MNYNISDKLELLTDYHYYCGKGTQMKDLHMHPYYEISIIIRGNIDIIFEDSIFNVHDGNILIYSPYTLHSIVADNNEMYERHNLYVKSDYMASMLMHENMLETFKTISSIIAINEKQKQKLLTLLDLLNGEENPLNKRLLLTLILNTIYQYSCSNTIKGCHQRDNYINDILNYIYLHFGSRLIAEDIAKKFSVSRTKLINDFKAATGLSLNQYIVHVRLSHAQQMLALNNCIEDISQECGFANSCNFYRVFKKYFNDTPKNYKQYFNRSNSQI